MTSDPLSSFLDSYETRFREYEASARQLEATFRDVLLDAVQDIQAVSARAKSPDSLRLKAIMKGYSHVGQLQDLIGVRVITYYSDDVDQIGATVRSMLDLDEANSRDPRAQLLAEGRFGYRSLHLVGTIRDGYCPDAGLLSGLPVEVQIRTVLDHVWAELEHRVIYKSGSQIPLEVGRSYLALAGSLELLEQNFLQLRREMDDRVSQYRDAYERGYEKENPLDASRLVALMEARFPSAIGWRRAEQIKAPFRIEPRMMVAALSACGIATGGELSIALAGKGQERLVADFAPLAGTAPPGVTHLARLGLLIGSLQPEVLNLYCRGLFESDEFRAIFRQN